MKLKQGDRVIIRTTGRPAWFEDYMECRNGAKVAVVTYEDPDFAPSTPNPNLIPPDDLLPFERQAQDWQPDRSGTHGAVAVGW